MSIIRKLYYFARLGRPIFLAGGVILHALGIAIARYQGFPINWQAAFWGQVIITATQLMTHYSNDYFDLEADRANRSPTRWSGGSRVLPEGLLPARVALLAALSFAVTAMIAILVMGVLIQPGIWTFLLPLVVLAVAWEYSAPPLRLHSRGAGELTVALIVPVATPLVGFTFQTGYPSWLPLLASFPLACFQIAMIISVNLPDADGDLQVDKQTLVVRLGPEPAARIYLFQLAQAYISLPILAVLKLPLLAALAVLCSLPLALWLAVRMLRREWAKPAAWNSLAFWSIGLLMVNSALVTAAFLWLGIA